MDGSKEAVEALARKRGSGRKCVLCCGDSPSISLFAFPSNDEVRKKWLEFCELSADGLKTRHRLCSLHFPASSFKTGSKKKLVDGAVPSIKEDQIIRSARKTTHFEYLNAASKSVFGSGQGTTRKKNVCRLCGVVENSVHRFTFPKDPRDFQMWVDVCGLRTDSVRSWHRLCEAHFRPADLETSNTSRPVVLLRKGSVPCRLLPSQTNEGDLLHADMDNSGTLDHGSSIAQMGESFTVEQTPLRESHGGGELPSANTFPRPVNDVTSPHCGCSKRAKVIPDVARRDMLAARNEITALRKENHRLKNNLQGLGNIVDILRRKNLLGEKAARLLKLSIVKGCPAMFSIDDAL